MAETLCGLRKNGGGRLKETVLWTNSSPTSNLDAGDLGLSAPMTDFDFIRVYYRVSTSVSTSNYIDYPIALIESLDKTANTISGVIAARFSGGIWVRGMRYTDSTHLYFPRANSVNTQGESQAYVIPIQISGIKF